MYNGIGLLTPRGSGTSGHVQNNKFNLRSAPPLRAQPGGNISDMEGPKQVQPDKSILEHKSKREIELAVAQEQAKLEDEGLPEADIEEAIKVYREMVTEKFKTSRAAEPQGKVTGGDTHEVAQRKIAQMNRLQKALNVQADIKEGDAFNRELQEQKRLQAIEEREAKEVAKVEKQREREKREKEAEKERKRREKEREKERAQRQQEQEEKERMREERTAKYRAEWEQRVARSNDQQSERERGGRSSRGGGDRYGYEGR
eukprot:CAMPEP_0202393150 /NCGR_PEP_ID=MMETSP1127-20130417/92761_1 /ASSEMBLY_ACC=CAM_ASM_000462 /TAXON_ID=3047 /ORGANISM="Dunaliella tertiolecta, Strain CCMP1320" /LENGTH=257 /DNA_ID=CAMNT_0048995719 /DNA_START=1163 /DNA_END=1933 /DNA_ORIENTATION=-